MAANGMPILADNAVDDDGYLDICERTNFNEMTERIAQETPPAADIVERCRVQNLADNIRCIL